MRSRRRGPRGLLPKGRRVAQPPRAIAEGGRAGEEIGAGLARRGKEDATWDKGGPLPGGGWRAAAPGAREGRIGIRVGYDSNNSKFLPHKPGSHACKRS